MQKAWAYVNVGPKNAKFADNAYDVALGPDGNYVTQELPGMPAVIKFHPHSGQHQGNFYNKFTWHVGGFGETYNIRVDTQNSSSATPYVELQGCYAGDGNALHSLYQGPAYATQTSNGVWEGQWTTTATYPGWGIDCVAPNAFGFPGLNITIFTNLANFFPSYVLTVEKVARSV